MNFKIWFENVLAHISGASGSGKTTLANKLAKIHPNIIFKDLDDFDDEATNLLGFDRIKKKDYTDEMLSQLAKKRQKLMDAFIKKSKNPIIFVGHHTEGNHVLHIPTKNRFLLNTDAKTSAWRGYLRDKQRTLKELPQDEKEAQDTIDWLVRHDYQPMTDKDMAKWIGER